MTSKFEQLIEYVINDEEQKARELFHDIVVEKSREIYENLMQEEAEEDSEEELDESEEEDSEEEDLEEGMMNAEENMSTGDAAENFMDEVEVEEEGMMEGDGEEEFEGGEEGLEDRVVDLEDKLDELMAEFEAMMGNEGDSDFGAHGGDELEVDDTEEFNDGEGEEDDSEEFELSENVDLKAAPAPVKSEEGSVNKKGVVAANSGARGAVAKPVNPDAGGEEKGRTAPGTKDLISDFQNKAGAGMKDQKAAPKPVTAQASGVNTRTPFPKG
jgi:hypothetical protein